MHPDNDLTTAPIPALVRRIAAPASLGMVFNTLYNVTDTYFAGLLPGVSTPALAALAASFPVFFLILSLGNGLASGTTTLTANALGARDLAGARRIAAQALGLGLAASLATAGLGLALAPALFRLLGAKGPYLDLALEYMNPILAFAPLFILPSMQNAGLNAQGRTKPFRNILIIGCALNAGLDPWLAFGGWGLPALGLSGIAWATVLVQGLQVLYLGRHMLRTPLGAGLAWRELAPNPAVWAAIARQGLPACASVLSVGAGIFLITHYFGLFGPDAVAAYGIATRIEQLALLPTMGLGVAALTLAAQNLGAKRLDRVRQALHASLKAGAMLTVPATLLTYLLAGPLMRLFTPDPAVAELGAGYLRVVSPALFAYVALFLHVSLLYGIKEPLFAVWLGLARQIVAPWLLFWLCTGPLGLGLESVWWSIIAVVLCAAGFTACYVRQRLDRLERAAAPAPPPAPSPA